jgi:hypothetical protein
MKKTWYLTEGYIKNLFYDPKKQLLDPLCTITSIIELLFRPPGTKFGINNHSIIMDISNEIPTSSWQNFQSYKRYWHNDSRENVSKLGIVVKRLIEWYIIPTYELINNKCKMGLNTKKSLESSMQINSTDMTEITQLWKCLNELTNFFCMALETLIETYKDGNVIWTIQNLINLINDSKKGCYDVNKIPKIIIAEDENIINFDKIKSLWTLKSLCEINELYNKCYVIMRDINTNNNSNDIGGGLIVNIVNNGNNDLGYSDDNDENEKKKQIENYLSAIKIFINAKNDSFRDLLIKSASF